MGVPGGLKTGRVTPMGGAADAVSAVLTSPEGRSHEEGQHLVLGRSEGERGGAVAPSPVPFVRWML
jgi:hypothetical protein